MLNINNTNTANLTLEQQRDTMTDAQLREEIGNFRLKGDTVNVKKLSDYIQNRTEEQSKKVEEAEITFKQQFERDILGKIDEKGNFIHQATDDAGKKAEYDSWVQAFMRDISKYRNLTGNQDQKLEAQNKKVGDLIAELNDEKTTTTTLEKKVDEAWLNPPSVIDLVYWPGQRMNRLVIQFDKLKNKYQDYYPYNALRLLMVQSKDEHLWIHRALSELTLWGVWNKVNKFQKTLLRLQRKKVADYLKAIQEKVDDQKINGKNERTKAQARMLSDRIDEVRAAYEKEVTEALEKKKSNVHERIYGRQAPIQFYPNSSNIQGSGRAAA